MNNEVIYGVGKKMRSAYLAGKISEQQVLLCYNKNKSEADRFVPFGWSVKELIEESNLTHNPILREKLRSLAREHQTKAERSKEQNELSLKKLDYYLWSALGIGMRPVMQELNRLSKDGNKEAEIILLLMQIEFANLTAKKRHDLSKVIYQRKDLLLQKASDLLYDNNWECGVSYNPGKNASHIIYVFLPNGSQLSWHSNNYDTAMCYDEICTEWDGRACSSLEKLFTYAHERFGIGNTLTEYKIAS